MDARARTRTPTRRPLALLFTALGFVTLLSAMSQHLFVPALPQIVAELDGGAQVSWVIVAFILASIPMMPVIGKLSDLFGRRALLLVCVGLFTAGSLVGALAPSMEWLIVGRILQGSGSGGLVILPQAAIADLVPARRRGLYVGILSAVFAAASIAGPAVGGLLAQGPGWRWGFWVNVPLGVLAALGVLFLLRLPRPPRIERIRIDYAGMILVSIATVALALVAIWGGVEYEWSSPTILGIAAVGVVAVVLFPFVERRARSPVLPLTLFHDRNFVLTSAASIGIAMVMFSFLAYLPTFVQTSLAASPAEAGLVLAPMAVGSLAASTLSGQIVARTGRYKAVLIVGALIVACGAGLMAATTHDSSLALSATAGGVVGLGIGSCFSNIIIVVQNSFPHAQVGVATAGTSLFRQIGGMFGTALVGSLVLRGFADHVASRVPEPARAAAPATPDAEAIGALPGSLRPLVVAAYNDAMLPVYVLMVILAVGAAMLLCFVRAVPLAEAVETKP